MGIANRSGVQITQLSVTTQNIAPKKNLRNTRHSEMQGRRCSSLTCTTERSEPLEARRGVKVLQGIKE